MATTPPELPVVPYMPRHVAAQINPLISSVSSQMTHERVNDLVRNVCSLASEFHEREGFNFLTTNPIYALAKAALQYEIRAAAQEGLKAMTESKRGPDGEFLQPLIPSY